MNRTIKFRGQHFETEEWIFGDLINNGFDGTAFFLKGIKPTSEYPICVDMNTVGQFSGLEDINGVEIYESDILSKRWKCEVYVSDEGTFMVKFHTNPQKNKPMTLKKYLNHRVKAGTSDIDCKIIGNIHENPELLNN